MKSEQVFGRCGMGIYLCLLVSQTKGATPPSFAAAVGYTNSTFSSTFDRSSVDLRNTVKPGYEWYISRFCGYGVTPASAITANNDDTITLENTGGANSGILTAGHINGKWVGTVFGGGGYFEAILKFDPQTVTNRTKGWPAWWSIPIEHELTFGSWQWPGQAEGYAHYVEPDFFEWNIDGVEGVPPKTYNVTMNDWSGIWTPEKGYPVCKQNSWTTKFYTTPATTDFKQYHKYGWLWIPASPTRKSNPKYYFEDLPNTNSFSWTQFTNQPPTPSESMEPWTFGILDQQHLVLILGSGDSGAMTVKAVNVWQRSDDANGHNGKLSLR
jgi:hypothetical protein